MNKKLKIFIVAMVLTTLCVFIPKEDKEVVSVASEGNVWYGNEYAVAIKEGKDEYKFRSFYPSGHSAYEMSNHMVTIDNENYDIPQTLMMVDASRDYTWTPDDVYQYPNSNYDVLYCCDAETGYEDGIYYKRTNLEDATYYDKDAAAHIRAIVTNSYPYVTIDEMKAILAREGFVGADKIDRSEAITAVQSAIWAYSNENVGKFTYGRSFSVPHNTQWGGSLHDYTSELDVWWPLGKRKFATNDEVANRINSLIQHLINKKAEYSSNDQEVISEINMESSDLEILSQGEFKVDLIIKLNSEGSNRQDNINLDILIDNEIYTTKKIQLGQDEYKVNIKARVGQEIKAIVSGTQVVPNGVYFYEPEGGRNISQSLVGASKGVTSVYAETDVMVIENIEPSNPPLAPEPSEEPIETDEPTQSPEPSEDTEVTEKVKPSKEPLDVSKEEEEVIEEDNKEKKAKSNNTKKAKIDITPDTSDNNEDLGLYIVIMLMVVVAMMLIRDELESKKE